MKTMWQASRRPRNSFVTFLLIMKFFSQNFTFTPKSQLSWKKWYTHNCHSNFKVMNEHLVIWYAHLLYFIFNSFKFDRSQDFFEIYFEKDKIPPSFDNLSFLLVHHPAHFKTAPRSGKTISSGKRRSRKSSTIENSGQSHHFGDTIRHQFENFRKQFFVQNHES